MAEHMPVKVSKKEIQSVFDGKATVLEKKNLVGAFRLNDSFEVVNGSTQILVYVIGLPVQQKREHWIGGNPTYDIKVQKYA